MEKSKKKLPGLREFGSHQEGYKVAGIDTKCKNCGILFTRNDPGQRLENRFIWFQKWVLGQMDLHRGLTTQHRIDFIKWYVYLSNSK
jgi:hypothetical protein